MRLLWTTLFLAVACNRIPPGAVPVGSLAVSEANLAGNPELGVAAEGARRELQRSVEATGKFVLRQEAPARIRLAVESARRVSLVSSAGPEVASVELTLELTSPAGPGEIEKMLSEGSGRVPTEAETSTDPEARLSAFRSAFRAALDDASRGLVWQVEARNKTDRELVQDLTAEDPRLRDYAIRALADRRNPAVVPQLLNRLSDENPVVALRAVGALVAIGDRRAVDPLIEMTRKTKPQVTVQILYALATLGGPTAEAYLYTLESGGPDDEVRRAATDALLELRRKTTEPTAHRGPTEPLPGGGGHP
ncbi:MAG: HEAT repeat domain-containing protein [Deltaproteobacteria bacterium]|nr:MAG: HEAT repeat domain-containing protein [Deltaproteobacteria bacterium]TMB26308.1 MAG: HEAT repeat domain-containing protein [Deltaproteobacteria bacterium]TMB35777.1 MAG: HEAT repeat domain-containing protein [Deltaproteobacteria bacterium]